MVEPATRQVSEDRDYRSPVLRHHLKELRVTSKQYREREVGADVVVDRDGNSGPTSSSGSSLWRRGR